MGYSCTFTFYSVGQVKGSLHARNQLDPRKRLDRTERDDGLGSIHVANDVQRPQLRGFSAGTDRRTRRCRRGVVVSGVCGMNEINARRARLVLGWVTVFGRVYHLGM